MTTPERDPGPEQPSARGILAALAGAASNQSGAALGAHAFDAIGPAGVVAIRQIVAALVLVPLARPRPRSLTRAQWVPVLALAAVFVTMNLLLYTAIERIGLGLAVTLEFLGPLGVALASSRRPRDLALALLAGVGVYVLVLPGPSSDLIGVAIALAAAGCWAGYILLNRTIGRRLPGLTGTALAACVSSVAYSPVLVGLIVAGRLTPAALAFAVAAGILSSAMPYACDLIALRHVPAGFFGLFMSVNPLFATLAGFLLLGQSPAAHELLGMTIVVAANALAMAPKGARSGRPRRRSRNATPASPASASIRPGRGAMGAPQPSTSPRS